MSRTRPDNELVTWDCCGNRWELILTRLLHPEREDFTPRCESCGARLLPALLQHYNYSALSRLGGGKLLWARAGVAELAREIGLLRAFYRARDEKDRHPEPG